VKFKDVSEKNPYFSDIKKLQMTGIFEADAKGYFNPDKPLTRGEMAKLLTIAFDLQVKADYDFMDVPVTNEFNEYVHALYLNGITTGYEDNTFKADGSLTRAHYAVFMYRAMNLDEDFVAEPIPEPKSEIPAGDGTKVKYSDAKDYEFLKEIPKPNGYVPGKYEERQHEIVEEIMRENQHGIKATFNSLEKVHGELNKFDENLQSRADYIGISKRISSDY
jgi:hypothetical protein